MSRQAGTGSGHSQRFDPRASESNSRRKGKSKGGRQAILPGNIHIFEEALDAGIDAEESAERWALGLKARRFFESALAMYIRATELNPTSADAAYNAARVQYLLATSFYLPPQALTSLQQSIYLYQRAVTNSPPLPDPSMGGQPSAFTLDILFNLATASLSLYEMLDETGLVPDGEEVNSKAMSIKLALDRFQAVAQGQKQVLLEQIRQSSGVVDYQPLSAQHSSDMDGDAEMSMSADEDEDTGTSAYTTSLVTPSSFVEVSLAVSNAVWAHLDLQTPLKDASLVDSAAQLALQMITEAEQIRDSDQLHPGEEWNERLSELRYARCSCRVTCWAKQAEATANNGLSFVQDDSASQAFATLQEELLTVSGELLSGAGAPSEPLLHTQQLCDLGDANMTLARARLRQLSNLAEGVEAQATDPATVTIARQTWSLLASASKLFLAANKLLDPSSSAAPSVVVLGASNVATTTDRTRAAISTSLANLSLLRATQSLSDALPEVISPETRMQILDNGRVYARRAVSELGLKWILDRQLGEHQLVAQAVKHSHADGGWEVLRAEADAILTTVRAVWMRRLAILRHGAITVSTKTLDANAMSLELQALSTICRALSGRTDDGGAWMLALNIHDPSSASGFGRYVDELIGEDGDVSLSAEERFFWASWGTAMTATHPAGLILDQ